MNLSQPKKYLGLSLILASLFVASGIEAQTIPAPASGTTSEPVLIEEPIILVDDSTPTDNVPALPSTRGNITREPGVALSEIRQTRITNLAANISNRMDAAVARLSNISARLEQRIIKMEEAGLETVVAREKLQTAKDLLSEAQVKLSDIDTLVNEATFSTEPRKAWQGVRERYREVASLIRQAHFALREVIMSLKNPVRQNQPTATTSEDTSRNTNELISN